MIGTVYEAGTKPGETPIGPNSVPIVPMQGTPATHLPLQHRSGASFLQAGTSYRGQPPRSVNDSAAPPQQVASSGSSGNNNLVDNNISNNLYSRTNVNGFVGVSHNNRRNPSYPATRYNVGFHNYNQPNGNSSNSSHASNTNNHNAQDAGRYSNPIDRNTLMASFQDHQASLFSQNLARLEQQLSQVKIDHTPSYSSHRYSASAYRQPFYNQDELIRIKQDLEKELTYFTHHPNKKFYKQMENLIEFADPDPLVQAYSQIHPPPLPEDMDISQHAYVQTCSRIQMNHLRLFNRQPRVLPAQFQKAFRRAVSHVSALMHLPEKLTMPTIDSLQHVRYDSSKFAGLEYARQKLHKRGDAHPTALQDAKETWAMLMRGVLVHPHDTRLGGKGKLVEMDRSKHGKVMDPDAPEWTSRGDNHGSSSSGNHGADTATPNISLGRLILMLSHRDLLILGALEQPLTNSYLDEQWPIYIGQSWYHGGAERFVNKMSRHAIYHCFDAKKFDAAIDGWLVKEALLILRSQYEDGMNSKYDTLWVFVYKSLVEVIICRDDGIRLQKHVGTTSGNCFNTLVQSIITLFLGYTALIVEADKRQGEIGINMILSQCEIEVLGDDMVMALETPWMGLTKEVLARVVDECFNIDWSGKKSFSTNKLMDDSVSVDNNKRFEGVQFLGMYFRHQRLGDSRYAPKVVVPYRPTKESYLSLLFPKHGGMTRAESWLRALGIYLNAAGNKDTQEWLEGYLDFLEMVPFTKPEVWPPNMERWIMKDYWSTDKSKPPPPRRITLQEWYRLACMPKAKDEDD
ncbi:hypothetical protein EDD11_002349 [Mortierella claussenii]|nr:hypothetical protein EDD11_002349 [Mortierella claussenii]